MPSNGNPLHTRVTVVKEGPVTALDVTAVKQAWNKCIFYSKKPILFIKIKKNFYGSWNSFNRFSQVFLKVVHINGTFMMISSLFEKSTYFDVTVIKITNTFTATQKITPGHRSCCEKKKI